MDQSVIRLIETALLENESFRTFIAFRLAMLADGQIANDFASVVRAVINQNES